MLILRLESAGVTELYEEMIQMPPDIVLLGPEWRDRALLRAQLVEEGCDVVAIDTWPMPDLFRRPGMEPRVLLIDLHGLPDPRATLEEVRSAFPAERVLVVTALGTLAGDDVRRLGFSVIERPATIGRIVAATRALLSTPPSSSSGGSGPSHPP